MWQIGFPGVILMTITVEVSGALLKYSFDSPTVCHTSDVQNIKTRWLTDDETVLINAKGEADNDLLFPECVIKFGPKSESKKKTVKLKVDSFYINDCGVYLAVQQSPTSFFNEHVSTLFNFSCKSNSVSEITFYADANNNVKIFLQKSDRSLIDYNFILNITLVEHAEVSPGISPALVIGICLVVTIAVIGSGCIVYRYLKITKFSKQQYEADAGYHPRNLSHHIQDSPQGSGRYSNLPLGNIEPSSSMHSQTCIVGSQGSDGLCTVCHRHHDDFAHVVDIGPNGEIMETHDSRSHHPTSHIRSAERDNLMLRPDSRGSTPRSRHTHGVLSNAHRQSQPLSGSASRLAPFASQQNHHSGLIGTNELMDDDDFDIDVSGNDLIPPSYDLSPPSYDEAVNMPKPDEKLHSTAASLRQPDVSETDPLYQNIETFPHGV